MNTPLRPMKSEVHAQKSRPAPLNMEAMARIEPPAMASASGVISGIFNLTTFCAMGESCEMRPMPALMLRQSMAQSIHHWGVLMASPVS